MKDDLRLPRTRRGSAAAGAVSLLAVGLVAWTAAGGLSGLGCRAAEPAAPTAATAAPSASPIGAEVAGDLSPSSAEHQQVPLGKHRFTLPRGFTIERVASSPLVDRPIVADFDEQGRLYVADSSGSNAPPSEQLKAPNHRIVRLVDTDGDGQFDQQTVFAEQVMFPEGALWFDGSLYVAAPPSIWKFTDRDGDGVADERSEWFRGGTLTGCANDLHGPYLGRDGWIYWCKGAFAEQHHDLPGRPGWTTRAAHIFRARPDGSGIEPVMTGGMDNPVDVAFTPSGERIFTTTFLQHPGGGKRDGLIHAVYGGVWGKDHDVIHSHLRTGPELMPVLAHRGAAAPCGLTAYDSGAFGDDFANNLFACEFNLHQVSRVNLVPSGASWSAEVSTWVQSDHLDFHPTDVLEDADGSLLIVDTGGWYKLCCPTSQLQKPDVLGAIYRVRRAGTELADPRGLKLAWDQLTADELAGLLGDRRPAVQRRAIAQLGRGGAGALTALAAVRRGSDSVLARRNAVWAATRHPDGLPTVRGALADADASVRQAAAHSAGLWRDRPARPALERLLAEESLASRRAAAEALGRIGDPAAVDSLLRALDGPTDAMLAHSLTYALIEIGLGDRERLAEQVARASQSDRPPLAQAALTVLDQLHSPRLHAALVVRHLESTDASLRAAAWWIVGRHPEWGADVAALVHKRLHGTLEPPEREALVRDTARLAASPAIESMLSGVLHDPNAHSPVVEAVLQIMAQAEIKEVPASWLDALAARLQQTAVDDGQTLAILDCLRSRNLPSEATPKLAERVARLAADRRRADSVRVFALARTPGKSVALDAASIELLMASLASSVAPAQRAAASELLARTRLSDRQLIELAQALKQVGPLEMDRLLPAFGQSTSTAVGRALIEGVRNNPARANARNDVLEPLLLAFSELSDEAQTLLAELNQGADERREVLDQLLSQVLSGDVRRGQTVFHSTKAACYSCHAIGYNGGTVGPDLTQIGKIRSERDLLESILYPSASLVRSYEPVLIVGVDGRTHNGLIRSERDGEVLLATGPNQEVRLARSEIEEIHPSKISVMPAGLDKQLSIEELADLIAFLKSRQ